MRILENPNPLPIHITTCKKCQCKFEYSDIDIISKSHSDANGRIGGTHYWSTVKYIKCPNCGEQIIIEEKSGYSSSIIGDMHITRDYHIIDET